MGPKTPVPEGDFFRQPLREQINLKHPLVRLADLIDWERLNAAMSASFVSQRGRPATSPRLIAGLLYLQHAFDLSDEDVVWQWLENPYWQVFTGETYLQTKPPIDPSSLTRWRKRLGEAGVEELLAETIEAAKRANVIKTSSLKRVIVDTTVMVRREVVSVIVSPAHKVGDETGRSVGRSLPVHALLVTAACEAMGTKRRAFGPR